MFRDLPRPVLIAALLVDIAIGSAAFGVDRAAELLPPSTVLYAEINHPPELLDLVLSHPASQRVRSWSAYQHAVVEPKFGQFQVAVRYVEDQLGMGWQEAFRTVTHGGAVLAFDARTKGAALLVQAADSEKLDRIKSTFLRLVREDAAKKSDAVPFEERDYRGVTIYRTKEGGFATYERWFVLVNKTDLGREILDALLDSRERSLADVETYQQARASLAGSPAVWVFGNVGAIREAGGAPKVFSGKADDPVGELLLGGVLEALKHSPFVTAVLHADEERLGLGITLPFERAQISPEREHYFGQGGTGQAPAACDVPHRLFTLTVHRNLSELWLRAGDLFDENTTDKLAEADGKLSTLFAGKDFGEDILGSLSPQLQIVAARQEFADGRPVPAIKLPAFALAASLRDDDGTAREFRRIFQSLIGFLNVVGAQNGQPQLELDIEPLDAGELITSTFVPEAGQASEEGGGAKIHYNFSPSLAIAGDRMIISSTAGLARALATADAAALESGGEVVNLAAGLSATVLQSVLRDNLSHLVSQNMLQKGHTRDEAQVELDTLLEILALFEDVQLALSTGDRALTLKVDVQIAEPASGR